VRRPPEASSASPKAATKWWRLSRWNGRQPLSLKVTYRGGGECWYEVHARGAVGRFPGCTQLHDVMDQVYGGERRSNAPQVRP
jgi:hypothetical protein